MIVVAAAVVLVVAVVAGAAAVVVVAVEGFHILYVKIVKHEIIKPMGNEDLNCLNDKILNNQFRLLKSVRISFIIKII